MKDDRSLNGGGKIAGDNNIVYREGIVTAKCLLYVILCVILRQMDIKIREIF